jgi:hypothetical protein
VIICFEPGTFDRLSFLYACNITYNLPVTFQAIHWIFLFFCKSLFLKARGVSGLAKLPEATPDPARPPSHFSVPQKNQSPAVHKLWLTDGLGRDSAPTPRALHGKRDGSHMVVLRSRSPSRFCWLSGECRHCGLTFRDPESLCFLEHRRCTGEPHLHGSHTSGRPQCGAPLSHSPVRMLGCAVHLHAAVAQTTGAASHTGRRPRVTRSLLTRRVLQKVGQGSRRKRSGSLTRAALARLACSCSPLWETGSTYASGGLLVYPLSFTAAF